ncbi:MAG: GHKL domain-containing protein [Cyclobacteriaceae bacterium]|nr:GHKL domain-containing protein [Cyclobacteriaceae bacterium]MCK5280921.1 GHKL domain-containing protein [Cyclobacteriaceae bacterium]
MGSNNLRFQIIIRITAIALTLFLLFQLVNTSAFSLTIILVLTLVIVQVVALIKFIDKTNKDIVDFFEAIKNDDFSVPKRKSGKEAYAQYLHDQFEMVIKKLKKSKLAKDVRQQYLTTIVQHVGIGLITFNEKGDVQIMNIAAKRLLKVENIKNISGLNSISEVLVKCFWELKTGGRSLITVEIGGDERQLSVYVIELNLGNENFKLISLQNIRSELEEKEMEAWQKLVRVLTHEIMNSVTPISSLANTVEGEIVGYLDYGEDKPNINKEDLEDIHLAVQTIQRRSDGLIRFVNDFRSLTHTPEPKFQMVSVMELFGQISILLKHEIESNHIKFIVNVNPQNLALSIDPELIQQVLINLIKNAVQALEERENKIIELLAYQDEKNNTLFILKDNGPGIDEEAQTKIFIPFFTTKKSGSGIGLSLSRQIMRQHNAYISVKSKVDEGTEFILRF